MPHPEAGKRHKQLAALLASRSLTEGDTLFYVSRSGQAQGVVRAGGILCLRCGRLLGCTEFERACAGSSLRRPCEHIFTASPDGLPSKTSLQVGVLGPEFEAWKGGSLIRRGTRASLVQHLLPALQDLLTTTSASSQASAKARGGQVTAALQRRATAALKLAKRASHGSDSSEVGTTAPLEHAL